LGPREGGERKREKRDKKGWETKEAQKGRKERE